MCLSLFNSNLSHIVKQIGRMNRTPVVTLEIHVVSNRDTVAHQAFDLRFDLYVPL